MKDERTEIRDGKEFTVTTLPADYRLTPSKSRERSLFQALSTGEKQRYIRDRIKQAKRKRGKRRRKR
jgi:hypothetical protein